jgi:hypothetical protein
MNVSCKAPVVVDCDEHWDKVVLAMHMDGTDNGTTFIDETGKTVSIIGNTVTKTGVKRFGTSSAYFDGVGDHLTVPGDFGLGTGDFTIECFAYIATNSAAQPGGQKVGNIVSTYSGAQGYSFGFLGAIDTGSSTYIQMNTSSGVKWSYGPGVSQGTWNHIAVCRASSVTKVYVNGVSGEGVVAGEILSSAGLISVGKQINTLGEEYTNYFNGYIDDLRITKGVARYTENFEVPTKAFPLVLCEPTPPEEVDFCSIFGPSTWQACQGGV